MVTIGEGCAGSRCLESNDNPVTKEPVSSVKILEIDQEDGAAETAWL